MGRIGGSSVAAKPFAQGVDGAQSIVSRCMNSREVLAPGESHGVNGLITRVYKGWGQQRLLVEQKLIEIIAEK